MSTIIRAVRVEDSPALAAIYAPAVLEAPTSFELEPPDASEMARRISKITAHYPWLVLDHDGAVLGYAYGSRHRDRAAYDWSVEVSAYVRGDAHRAGIGRALYSSLFEVLTLQGFCNAYAGIALPNPASVGMHTAVGFTPVGVYHGIGHKFGQWHDVAWFERPLAPRVARPPAPRPFPDVRHEPACAAAIAAGLPLVRVDRLPPGP